MQNPVVSNPKDLTVVSFHNATTFDFTPEMGCMFDGRPIYGKTGAPCIQAGETVMLPYHVGHLLALNLAKRVLNTSQPASVSDANIPVGVPIWSAELLQVEKMKYIKELYTEQKPIAESETDKLMAKVEEYKKMVEMLLANGLPQNPTPLMEAAATITTAPVAADPNVDANGSQYLDKKAVIAELEKRDIKFDARKSKADLEKLLI